MDPSLYRKVKKKINKCPNPLFEFWITEWMNDAKDKGLKSSYTYQKALNSLKKYPIPLESGKECKFLQNFGDKICQMLDKKLEEYVAEYGTTEPLPGIIDLARYKPEKKKRKKQEDLVDTEDLIIPDAPAILAGSPRKRRKSGGREYMPLPRSGPHALIITLFNNLQSGRDFMSKTELMTEAQPLADKSFTIPDPGCRYTSWSSMGTLIKKGFVIKESSPAKYKLTEAGCELATALQERDDAIGHSNTDDSTYNLNNYQHGKSTGESSTSRSTEPLNKYPSFPAGNHTMSDSDEDLPTFANFSTENSSQNKFQYIYIDDKGNEVAAKDKAAVLIDEELGIGFLCKCKYEDLLLSGKRYQLDTARAGIGDFIYAYLHNDDASDLCNPPNKMKPPNKKKSSSKSSRSTVSKQVTGRPNDPQESVNNFVTENLPLRDRIKSSGVKPDIFTRSPTVDLTNDNLSSVDSIIPTNPVRKTASNVFSRHSSIDSLSGMSQESEVDYVEPEYLLGPGMFDVVLIVDTHEHYGHGIPKTVLLPELRKYGVLFDVRPLQIGDFTWIAKEKGPSSSREAVLDYIVERKRMDDLAGSITDGRFREQKFRLCNCGLRNGIYLIEDYGSVKNFSIPEDTLNQAIANTQVIDNFSIKHTKDTKGSVAYLSMMTRYLQSLYADKTLLVYKLQVLKKAEFKNDINNPVQKLVSFNDFNENSVKTKAMTVNEMFAKMLVQVQGMTVEKAAAIVKVYTTPSALYDAYAACMTEKEKDTLLSNIKYGPLDRKINDTLSKQVHTLFCFSNNNNN